MLRRFIPFLRRPPASPPAEERLTAANENIPLMEPGDDPRAVLIVVREVLAEWRQANAKDGRLIHCPAARRKWNDIRALEQAILWKHFGRG